VTTKVTDKFGGRYPGKERMDGKRVIGMRFKVRIHGRVPEAPIKIFCICLKTAWPFPDLTVPCGLQRQRICDLAAADRLACAPAADLCGSRIPGLQQGTCRASLPCTEEPHRQQIITPHAHFAKMPKPRDEQLSSAVYPHRVMGKQKKSP